MKKALLALAVGLALSSTAYAKEERDFEIKTLSTAANTVSRGDVLVEVRAPRYARLGDLVVRLGSALDVAFYGRLQRYLLNG